MLQLDRFDVEEIGVALSRLIDSFELRATFRAKGLVHAQKFSWRETAMLTFGVTKEPFLVNRPKYTADIPAIGY
jgi:hypothetical protein